MGMDGGEGLREEGSVGSDCGGRGGGGAGVSVGGVRVGSEGGGGFVEWAGMEVGREARGWFIKSFWRERHCDGGWEKLGKGDV